MNRCDVEFFANMFLTPNCPSDAPVDALKDEKNRITLSQTAYAAEQVDVPYCKYVVALKDKKTGQVTFHPTPVYSFARKFDSSSATTIDKSMDARNKLGQQFGSKKRKLEIRQQTENKVSVDTVNNVASAMINTIDVVAKDMPTRGLIFQPMLMIVAYTICR